MPSNVFVAFMTPATGWTSRVASYSSPESMLGRYECESASQCRIMESTTSNACERRDGNKDLGQTLREYGLFCYKPRVMKDMEIKPSEPVERSR